MAKIISVSDEVYQTLTKLKMDMSYSAVIKGLISQNRNKEKILALASKGGIDLSKVKELKRTWKMWSEKYV